MVVARARLPEGCAREPRDNLLPADFQEVSHQRQPFVCRRRVAFVPIEHGGIARRLIECVGDLIAIFRIGPGQFNAAALADSIGEIAAEIAEEREGDA